MNGNDVKRLRKAKGLTLDELATHTGIAKGTLGRIESSAEDIKKSKNEKILIDYFKNDITVADNTQSVENNLHNSSKSKSVGLSDYNKVLTNPVYDNNSTLERNSPSIPMYNMPASASNIEMYGDPNDVKIIGYLNIPGASKDSFALPVQGHSMYPTLPNGVWGVVRPMEDRMDIEWGQVYYIEYGDYRVWKRLIKDEEDPDNVILYSDNITELVNGKPKYGSKTIKADRISKLCLLTFTLIKNND